MVDDSQLQWHWVHLQFGEPEQAPTSSFQLQRSQQSLGPRRQNKAMGIAGP